MDEVRLFSSALTTVEILAYRDVAVATP